MKGVLITISGFVQGVGYRKFVKKEATKVGLIGWVQNMPDGSVEAKVFGSQDRIEDLIALCKKGPFLSEVQEIKVTEIDSEIVPEDFSILHN